MKLKKIKKNLKGFTLVELVIVIAIVIVLSVVSVPIYRSYVDKAKMAEGYALLGAIVSAQKAYYSEYGNFLLEQHMSGIYTCNETVLGIDARGNKYFTWINLGDPSGEKFQFQAYAYKPKDLQDNGYKWLEVVYNITTGAKFKEVE